MNKIVKIIKKIEKKSYPAKWWCMQDCRTISDIADYCESTINGLKIFFAVDNTGYCLISDSGEICDIAGKFKLSDLFSLKKYIWSNYDSVYMDCRQSSRKLIRKLGGVIVNKTEYLDNTEKMCFFRINKI